MTTTELRDRALLLLAAAGLLRRRTRTEHRPRGLRIVRARTLHQVRNERDELRLLLKHLAGPTAHVIILPAPRKGTATTPDSEAPNP